MKRTDDYKKLEAEAQLFYDKVGSVRCPALDANVEFTGAGFYHLKYTSSRNPRGEQERKNRLASLPRAVDILKKTRTIQEYRETSEFIGTKKKGERTLTKIALYGFWAVIDDNLAGKLRYLVVVKYIFASQKFIFYGVRPYSQMITDVNGKQVKILGSLKELLD